MSRPGPAVGQVPLDHLDAPPRPVSPRGRPERPARLQGPGVGREQDAHARVQQGPAVLEVVSSNSELPTCWPLGGQERERHAAADDERVDLGGEDLEHLELVGHLGPAHDGHERPRRVLEDPAQHLDLPGEAQPGRARQELRRPDDGGVGAVGGAEGLVDVGVEALDEPLHEGGVVRLLARVEAQVLHEPDARAQHLQPLPHRVHLPARVGGAGRPAEVRARHHVGTLVEQPAQRRQGGGDPEVVGHRGLAPHADVQRDVEVDPHQHALPVEVGEVLEERDAAQRVHRFSRLPGR